MASVYGTLYDNGGSVFNVKHTDFGAQGNGIANDAPAINSALSTAAATGGIVFIPPGHYKCMSQLNIPSSVILVGSGYSSWLDFCVSDDTAIGNEGMAA